MGVGNALPPPFAISSVTSSGCTSCSTTKFHPSRVQSPQISSSDQLAANHCHLAGATMQLFFSVLAVLMGLASMTSALPSSDCYALNKDDYLYDFTDKIGRELELEGESSDFVLRFCVDVQNRSNDGYINFGRFLPQSNLKHQMDDIDFFQVYKYGDLRLCEGLGNDFTGREAEVEFKCGACLNGSICRDDFGCICNVTYNHNLCKAKVLVAVDCSRRGPRIFSGFSIGLQRRGWEVVKNGITQKDYREPFHNHSFESSQNSVFLYVNSTAGFPGAIEKAHIQVQPLQGLLVSIVKKATLSIPSATETITLLEIDWKCEETREQLYEVNIRIPIHGYDPVDVFLYKQCSIHGNREQAGISSMKMLEVVSLIILIGITLLGIIYKCKLQGQCKSVGSPNVPLINEIHDEEVKGREDFLQATMEVPLV